MFKLKSSIGIASLLFVLMMGSISFAAPSDTAGNKPGTNPVRHTFAVTPFYSPDKIWALYSPFIDYLNKSTGEPWELKLYHNHDEHEETVVGRYMMLAVTDNGHGMDKQTLSKIFEPFFTTKGIGHGTGLGLATVHGLVKQHGGNIWVYSEEGRGTTFKCYFPVVDKVPVVDQHKATKTVEFTSEHGIILLVEDNEMARNLAYEILKEHGLSVIAAESPMQALQLSKGVAIDLLITDVVMPGLTGAELNQRLLKLYPNLRTLYMSGYTSNVIVHHGVLAEGVNFIQKPFTVNEFAKKVEELLNS